MCMLHKIFSFKEGKSGRIEILFNTQNITWAVNCNIDEWLRLKINSLNKIIQKQIFF
jgi:hypothetical protein